VAVDSSVPVQVWRDPAVPPAERVADLLSQLTIPEKVAQLSAVRIGANATAAAQPRR
jgi:hypothetical protein